MSRHSQQPRKADMQCPACKSGNCQLCVDVLLGGVGRSAGCTCTKKWHTEGEPNRAQILDPETGTVHAPGLTVSPEGEVERTDTTGPSAIAGRYQCQEHDSGGAQCSFVGAKGEPHDHYVAGHR